MFNLVLCVSVTENKCIDGFLDTIVTKGKMVSLGPKFKVLKTYTRNTTLDQINKRLMQEKDGKTPDIR